MGSTRRVAFDRRDAKVLQWAVIIGLVVSATVTAIALFGAWLCGPFAALRTPGHP